MTDRDVLILIPTRGRPDMLASVVEDLSRTPGAWEALILHDGELDETRARASLEMHETEDGRIERALLSERRGYWNTLNVGLRLSAHIGGTTRPLIGYFANDCRFHAGWLEAALECFNQQFPRGLGLMAIRDGIHNGRHACHGFTTRAWLEVLYGEARFPPYRHLYGDSELTQFTQDLGAFGYCAGCRVEHLHPDVDKREPDEVDAEVEAGLPDVPGGAGQEFYNERWTWWDQRGAREAARARLEAS